MFGLWTFSFGRIAFYHLILSFVIHPHKPTCCEHAGSLKVSLISYVSSKFTIEIHFEHAIESISGFDSFLLQITFYCWYVDFIFTCLVLAEIKERETLTISFIHIVTIFQTKTTPIWLQVEWKSWKWHFY